MAGCEFQGFVTCSQYDSQHGKIFGVRWIPAKIENKAKIPIQEVQKDGFAQFFTMVL